MSKKKKVVHNTSKEVKGLMRYFHLTKRFRQRVDSVEPTPGEIFDMLDQVANDPGCFIKWTKKYNVGVYKVKFRERVIIIVSNKRAIFTTYGPYIESTNKGDANNAIEKISLEKREL